uniref:hypothetical protein n=1 Tax=Pseudonocardia sp. CA-138482 TaxID=3240023 RepID=UPI003F490C7D
MTHDLTPVEMRSGLLVKREDLHVAAHGVNGGKLRACQHLIGQAAKAGATRVISAASVLSPQNAMAAVVAAENGLPCTVILGGSKPETAPRHPAIRIAAAMGATFEHVPVGYNPYLQAQAARRAEADPSAYWLRYGITTPPASSTAELVAFHDTGAVQVRNLPGTVRTLVIPFGSGNSAASVLYGLTRYGAPRALQRVVLIGIGPDRLPWLHQRLADLDVPTPCDLQRLDLHGTGYARYGDKMAETLDGVVLHPTYEGKVARYLNARAPDWWARRDGTTCLWIVGGPLPGRRR